MSTNTRPYWIEIVHDEEDRWTLRSDEYIWPFFKSQPIDDKIATEIKQLCSEFLSDSKTTILSLKSGPLSGHLILKRIMVETSLYRGMWIPNTLPSLIDLAGKIIQGWDSSEPEMIAWIREFFNLRQNPDYLQLFQSAKSNQVQLPPLFGISTQLLKEMQDSFSSNFDLNETVGGYQLSQLVDNLLPEDYRQVVKSIPFEFELLTLLFLQKNLYSQPLRIEYISSIYERICNIHEDYAKIIILNYLQIGLQSNQNVTEEIIEFAKNMITTASGMNYILLLRILSRYYESTRNFDKTTEYYEKLMDYAKTESWYATYDLIISQLGLARMSAMKGNYQNSFTFYAFAKHSMGLSNDSDLYPEVEKESVRISALSANQQLQTGLYLVNQGNVSLQVLNILIDGLQNGLTILLGNLNLKDISVNPLLAPLLSAASNIVTIYETKINEMYGKPIDFRKFRDAIDAIITGQVTQDRINLLIEFIDTMNYRENSMVEKIGIFYNDGRYIADFELQDKEISMMDSNPEQTLFSSAMTAVSMMIEEATKSEDSVEEITIGNKLVIFEKGQYIICTLFAISNTQRLRKRLKEVVIAIEEKYGEKLEHWMGDLKFFEGIDEFLIPLMPFLIDNSR